MADSFTEISHQGYFSRIAESIKGILFGVVLFIISFPLLFWNEGRAVHMAQALTEGAANVISVSPDAISAANEHKEVHFTGDTSGELLADPEFGVSAQAIQLKRKAELYQWKEDKKDVTTKDTVGGGSTTKTTYSYSEVWSDAAIDSGKFNDKSSDHHNSSIKLVENQTQNAKVVKVGAFTLPQDLVEKITNYEDLPLTAVPDAYKSGGVVQSGKVFIAPMTVSTMAWAKPNPDSPKIGDLRVSFQIIKPGTVSVIAQQTGSTLSPYPTKTGTINLLYVGPHSPQEMFDSEQRNNVILTWVLRLVGFIIMALGMYLIFNPLKVLSDVIGFVGDLVGIGLGLACGLVAFILSLVTIAVAWVVYRPMIGILLLAVAAAATALLVKMRQPRKVRA